MATATHAAGASFGRSTAGICGRDGKDGNFSFGLPGMAAGTFDGLIGVVHAGSEMLKATTTFFTFVFIDWHNARLLKTYLADCFQSMQCGPWNQVWWRGVIRLKNPW